MGTYTVRNPSATKRFMNSFQDPKITRSQLFEETESEFTKRLEEGINTRRKVASVSFYKSSARSDTKPYSKTKLIRESKFK